MPSSRAVRLAVSVLIIGHLWAVVSRPIEFATLGPFGASPSATLFRAPVRAYSQFAYLDHGYAFFAPDPGPSHLIEAEIVGPDQQRMTQRFPDRAEQSPRLLYHRHFMLSEFLNDVYHPPGEPPQEIAGDPLALRGWHQSRRRYESVRDSILNRLETRYPDSQITIQRLQHRPPGLPEFIDQQMPLDDPRLYRILHDSIDGELPTGDLLGAVQSGAVQNGAVQTIPPAPLAPLAPLPASPADQRPSQTDRSEVTQ